jgi:hypothetical protein
MISDASLKFHGRVSKLLGHFRPCPPSPESLDGTQAIFGFAFGYQLPNPTKRDPSNRVPGRNNIELAAIADRLHTQYGFPLFLQFEIAMASTKTYVPSPIDDLGTVAVAKSFLRKYKSEGKPYPKKVVIVAHGHHVERCRIILDGNIRIDDDSIHIEGIPSREQYFGYDPLEAQPRVMSPEEFILNDFVSMAAMA